MASSSNNRLALFLALTTVVISTAVLAQQVQPAPPVPSAGGGGSCPMNSLKLEVCANVVNQLMLNNTVGKNDDQQCCPLLEGLVDLDAAFCLCIAIKANVLGISLDVPIDPTLLLNHCGKIWPADFTCPDN